MNSPRFDRVVRDPARYHGRIELPRIESAALAGNAAGDPHLRELPLLVPRGAGPFPLVFVLAGFTGRGQRFFDDSDPWKPSLALELDRAMAEGALPPTVFAFPDCFTRFGGSQYVDSTYNGRYEEHVAAELVQFVEARLPILPGARGVIGKSSGGVGALHLVQRRPGLFRAAASISGDCGFEDCHAPAFHGALRALVPHAGDVASWIAEFERTRDLGSSDRFALLNTVALSACYSPAPLSPLGFELPFDPRTGERRPEVWRRWLAFDPLETVEQHARELGQLEFLHLECGLQDEFNIQWGTRRLSAKLTRLGIAHTHGEHAGGHRGLQERYLETLPRLVAALIGSEPVPGAIGVTKTEFKP